MRNFYVAVISHGHSEEIRQIGTVSRLAGLDRVRVIVKDNIRGGSGVLADVCSNSGAVLLVESPGIGFGENNNYVFNHCVTHLGMQADDYFLVLNPDVDLSASVFEDLMVFVESNELAISTINLFRDKDYSMHDYSIRTFPGLSDFILSFLLGVNRTKLPKDQMSIATEIDWAAGSFLLFKASLYMDLKGFDPAYFMYCEDVDICWRARKKLDAEVTYLPSFRAVHLAKHANRSLFSMHFVWHLRSAVRFLCRRYGLIS